MTDYNDGKWHAWNGGECPLHPETVVDLRYECGRVVDADKAGMKQAVRWLHTWPRAKVIAFRVVKPYREPRTFWAVGSHLFDTEEKAATFLAELRLNNPALDFGDVYKLAEVLPAPAPVTAVDAAERVTA